MGGGRSYGSDWILTMPVIQLDSTAHAHWDEMRVTTDHLGIAIPYHELKKYDVRRGPQWTTAVKVGSAVCEPWIDTEDWFPGSEIWQVRVRAGSGKFSGSSATTTPTLTIPPSHLNGDSHDAYTLGFPDSKTDCEVDEDGDLRFSFEETTATYESTEIDLGATALWRISHLVHVEATDFRFKIGRTINDISGLTIGDVVGTPAGLAGIKLYDPQVTWTLEATVYETSGGPGTYQEFTPGNYYGRYIQFKLTVNRDVGADLPITDATNTTPIVVTTSTNHGLLTGQRVRVFGVEGNTAANGDWRGITYVSDTTFSLDDSEGDGAYTTGGTVVQDLDVRVTGLEMAFSKAAESDDIINVQKFGAVADGDTGTPTNNLAAINAATAEASNRTGGLGGIVFFPAGVYGTLGQIKVPNRVWLVGENSFASRIKASTGFPTSTAVVRLGEGAGIVFNCRLVNIRVDCNNIVGSTGVYSNEIQEQSGCFNFDVGGYRAYGINFESSGTAASQCGVEQITLYASTSGHTGGIRFAGVAGQGYIKHVTAAPSGAAMGTDAILVDGGDVYCEHIHMERHTDGIHYTDGSSGSVKHVYGHVAAGSVVNLIHLGDNCNVTLEDINAAGSDGNILVDDARTITVTVAETGYIQFYANNEIKLGPLSLGPGSQSAIVDVAFPALAGVGDEIVMRIVEQILSGKTLVEPVIMNVGDTAAQRIEVNNVAQQEAGNIVQIVNIGDDGAGGPITREFLINTRVNGGAILWQDTRSLRLVDCQVGYNGQSTPWARLTSADQTDEGMARIPDLGDAATHDLVFLDLIDQTFTQEVVFDGGAQFGVDADHTAVDAAGDVAFVGGGGLLSPVFRCKFRLTRTAYRTEASFPTIRITISQWDWPGIIGSSSR